MIGIVVLTLDTHPETLDKREFYYFLSILISDDSFLVQFHVTVLFCTPWKHQNRSNVPEVFYKNFVVRNFTKFTGNHVCQSFFLNKIADWCLQLIKKKRLWDRCFPVNFARILRTSFPTEHLGETTSLRRPDFFIG